MVIYLHRVDFCGLLSSRRVAAAGAVLAGISLGGCASSTTRTASPSPSPTPTTSTSATDPAEVALQYEKAIAIGDLGASRALLAPDSVDVFDRLTAAIPKSAKGNSRNLAVGHITQTAKKADVLLTGTLCHTGSCVTNTSRTVARANLIFVVHLERVHNHWLVTFPRPSASLDEPQHTSQSCPNRQRSMTTTSSRATTGCTSR